MWNPFKKKDPMKGMADNHYVAEVLLPKLVDEFNANNIQEDAFTDKKFWGQMSFADNQKLSLGKFKANGTDFKNNHSVYIVLVTFPEVKMLTMAKASIIAIDRTTHHAVQYILESSFGGSMVIKMENGTRQNTCVAIPVDNDEFVHFLATVVQMEGIRWK